MKNILLSVVVLGALVAAGVGGTLADFSDIEISEDNYFKTGSLDLVVSDYMGVEYDDPPVTFSIKDAWPCCDKSEFIDLHNYGQGFQKEPYAYIHIKNLECGWVVPKRVYAWLDLVDDKVVKVDPPAGTWNPGDQGTGLPKPVTEPEYVAECGGVAGEDVNGNPVVVPGIGFCYGEDCELPRHIDAHIEIAGPFEHDEYPKAADVPDTGPDAWRALDLSAYDTDDPANIGVIKLHELECIEIPLGQIPNCQKIWVHIWVHLQDFDEEDAYAAGLIPTTYFAETYPEAKWDHWPTNAYQKDSVHFDIAFELLQNAVP